MAKYDLVVIGSGPGGQRAAIQAAKLGKRVALVERGKMIGGVCIHYGTIPSKTMREAVLFLSGFSQRGVYGPGYQVKKDITMEDLIFRIHHVLHNEVQVVKAQMQRNGVDMIEGTAHFIDAHKIGIREKDSDLEIESDFFVMATGTTPARPADLEFDGQQVFDSDGVFNLKELPRSLTIVGAGVIGCEYACMFAALGVKVTLIERRKDILRFVDEEVVDALVYEMRQMRVTLRTGEALGPIEKTSDGKVVTNLESGKKCISDSLLYCLGRGGSTGSLDLDKVGIEVQKRGYLKVNEFFQTEVSHIYAVGDVIGFPSLASTSAEQGRMAAAHAFGVEVKTFPESFPYGIYTIPEISTIGKAEEELTEEGIPYETGVAWYKEIARGQIIGDERGMLKLIFHRENKELLGVHIIGQGASELVHIGQTVMHFGGKVEYFVDNVFNYPTLAECYKVAALHGLNKLKGT